MLPKTDCRISSQERASWNGGASCNRMFAANNNSFPGISFPAARRFLRMLAPLVAVLLLFSFPAFAEVQPGSYSISPYVGGFLFDGDQDANLDLEHRPVYGLRFGYDFTKHVGAEAVLGYVATKHKATSSDADVYNYRIEGLYHFLPERKLVPFLALGVGGMSISYDDNTDNKTRAVVDYGAGLKYFLTDRVALRADVRHVVALGSVYNNLEYTVGLTFYFGGAKAAASAQQEEVQPTVQRSALAAPIHLTATAVSDSQIDLAWNASEGATGYKVYRDGSYLSSVRATSAQDRGLKPNTRYCYVVTATDDAGRESARSNEACATTMEMQKREAEAAAAPYELANIYFDFDRYVLKDEARKILDQHADWLKKNKDVKVLVEGHCDERGTAEYNMALGERRANAAAEYLIDLGIEKDRISTISYGFERPLDTRHNEEAWAKNRRDQFVISAGGGQK